MKEKLPDGGYTPGIGFPYAVADMPCCFVGDTCLNMDIVGAYASFKRTHNVYRRQPFPKGYL